jgi:hypothetical protein
MEPEIIIAIGDLHGHYPALKSLFACLNKKYDLIENGIIRKNALMISTGDSIDRGDQALKIIDYFMHLSHRNPDSFKALMGNHELLALENLDEARKLIENENPRIEMYANNRHGFNGGVSFLSEFGTQPKPALIRYVHRMSREGDIGIWMRNLLPRLDVQINGKKILFVHAGIPEGLRDRKSLDEYIEEYNSYVKRDTLNVGGNLKKYGAPLIVKNGVFWDRTTHTMNDAQTEDLAKNLDVDFIVTGHTPNKRIKLYGNRVIDIDVGMCTAYGARTPAALVIQPNGIFAQYATGECDTIVSF